MATPTTTVRIDFAKDGSFTTGGDDVSAYVKACSITRGRSADFSTEATGSATITLQNSSGTFNTGLAVGLPVHVYSTYSATDYPMFYGHIERISFDPDARTCTITAYDPLRQMSETDVVIPANDLITRTAREMRVALLDEFERGNLNLIHNPSFTTDTSGWNTSTYSGGTLTRITADYASSPASGEYVATGANNRAIFPVRIFPRMLVGGLYRMSVYLRVTAGTASWNIGIYNGSTLKEKAVTVTTTWTRFTYTTTMAVTATAAAGSLYISVGSTGAGTVRIDNAMLTRGPQLTGYSDTGTGRYPNYIGNGNFEGSAAQTGWIDLWGNLVGNPSIETDLTGWSASADGFHTAGASLTRTNAVAAAFGSWYGSVVAASALNGAHYAITGTFTSGVAYPWSIRVSVATGTNNVIAGLGSTGTPADKNQSSTTSVTAGTWTTIAGTWTPSSNRTDAHLYVMSNAAGSVTILFDGASVVRGTSRTYTDTGPGGGTGTTGGASPSSIGPGGRYGYWQANVTTPATTGAGRAYDFSNIGAYFLSGQAYTFSISLYSNGATMPYKIGIGSVKSDGTWDEATATGTLSASTWTDLTVTWTPSADRSAAVPGDVVAWWMQTNATSHDVRWDGARVNPGSSADAFEMAQWDVSSDEGEATDTLAVGASFSGNVLSALATLNGLSLTRHWIKPTMSTPFYQYVTQTRDELDSLSVVETFDNDFHDLSADDIDRASIINTVSVTYATGDTVSIYSDSTSVDAYGARSTTINGSSLLPNYIVADLVGPALVSRYSVPRARPTMSLVNRFPSQLARDLNDLVTVKLTRLGINGNYLIQTITTTITEASKFWASEIVLEESPV